MDINVFLGLVYVGLALLLILLAIPLVQGRIKMNHFYGIRLRKSFESDDNWYKINAYGGRRLIVWSCVMAAIGVAAFFVPLGPPAHPSEVKVVVLGLAPVVVLIPWIVEITRYSRKL